MLKKIHSIRKKFFHKIASNQILYSQCLEDPIIDKNCLDINSTDHVLNITSAGCNSLHYLLYGAEKVYAIDLNPHQNALLELKKVMIQHLDYEDFFKFFGLGKINNPEKIYKQTIRPYLTQKSQKIWDEKINLFNIHNKINFHFSSTFGFYSRVASKMLKFDKKLLVGFCSTESLVQQREFYHNHIELQCKNSPWLKLLILSPLLYFIGVPNEQLKIINDQYIGNVRKFFFDFMHFVGTQSHICTDNYFWKLILTGEYSKNSCPEYLKEENFHKLKNLNLNESISIHDSSLLDFLKNNEVKINKYVLLDHMDWFYNPKHHSYLSEQWKYVFKRSAAGGRVLWRSAGLNNDWMNKYCKIENNGEDKHLFSYLNFKKDLSEKWHKQDRMHTYGSLYIADILI